MRRPDFFIVGAPKAGTSAMAAHLALHPDIFMSPLKEPQFFGVDQHRLGYDRWTLDEYLSFFARAGNAARVGEASTNYLYSRSAASEIAAFAPDASVIVMLRNPIEIMHAYHSTMVVGGFEPIRDFAEALAAESDRRRGHRLPARSGVRENLYYRDIADLAPHLQRYVGVFGWERIHVIVYEDWRAKPAEVYGDTLEFLGVDRGFVPEFGVVNANRRVRSTRIQDFVFDPPRPVGAVLRRIPLALRAPIRYRLLAANATVSEREPLEPGLLRELREEFAPKVAELGGLIGRDLSGWSAGSAREVPDLSGHK